MIAALAGFLSAPASAQLAAEAAVQTDYRWRGYSMSDGQPAASVSLAYDDPSGLYAGATAVATVRHDDPEVLSLQGNLGYALRIARSVSLDGGVYHAQYYSGYGTGRHFRYDEFYLGLAVPHVSARLSYSPDYLIGGTQTLYAEVEGGFEPATDWTLSAHLGDLEYLDTPLYGLPRRRYDWRIGASRQLGRLGLHVDLSGRIEGHAALPLKDSAAIVGTVTRAF